jgi:hypothetical protein
LIADTRFQHLRPASHRYCLVVAAVSWADRDGFFFVKAATWAATAGVSITTIRRAIRGARAVGLLETEAYLRPDGLQGSNHFWLRVETAIARDQPCRLAEDDQPDGDDRGRSREQAESPATGLNGFSNEKSERAAPPAAAAGAAALEIEDFGQTCQARSSWKRVDTHFVCQQCGDKVRA